MPATPSNSPPPRRTGLAGILGAAGELEREIVQTYDEHWSDLFRFALAFSKNSEVAEHALQESFLRYFRARLAGKQIRDCRAWLYRGLRSLLDRRRKHGVPHPGVVTHVPEPDYLRSELSRRIHIALTPREMQCVQLRAQGLTYEEIAKVMQIRRGTVGAVLTRASKKIREVFGPLAEGLP